MADYKGCDYAPGAPELFKFPISPFRTKALVRFSGFGAPKYRAYGAGAMIRGDIGGPCVLHPCAGARARGASPRSRFYAVCLAPVIGRGAARLCPVSRNCWRWGSVDLRPRCAPATARPPSRAGRRTRRFPAVLEYGRPLPNRARRTSIRKITYVQKSSKVSG